MRGWWGIVIIVLGYSCSPKYQTGGNQSYAPDQWAQRFTTYAWAKEPGTVNREHPLMDSRAIHNWVMPKIDSLLVGKDLQQIKDPDQADLIVSFHWLLRTNLEEVHNTAPYALEWYQKGTYLKSMDFKEKNSALLLVRIRQRFPDTPIGSAWAAAPLRGANAEKTFILGAMRHIVPSLAKH